MRKKIVAGNWKMNCNFPDTIKLISEITKGVVDAGICKGRKRIVIIAPSFPFLSWAVLETGKYKNLAIAAQNCHSNEMGAFTGEVSARMLYTVSTEYVIIGHSERRNYFKETDEFLAKKVDAVIEWEMKPIFCCGEILAERESGNQFEVVKQQLKNGIFQLTEVAFGSVVVAYEPVWAIGTGLNASPEQAQEMHAYIRRLIAENYNDKIADNTSIIYGGSCNAQNAATLFANPDVDGGLIGGASLIAKDFLAIVNSF